MIRAFLVSIAAVFILGACTPPSQEPVADGKFRPAVFKTPKSESGVNKLLFRHLDTVNAIRTARGLSTVELSAQLNAAAATHSIDMAAQQRPWHFGSDGSSPLDRVARTGYAGIMLSENISETYENDTETLKVWMGDEDSRAGILDPSARFIGLSWHQEKNGKIWWTQILGS
ncbi:CAP domain-containing protein [Amylibacter sp. SFDW26]|uniref:CAP domain-containing protein n=1 Tax=Amylibacter sp. SFDW26 TaxID=2652722 RepID=UPI00126194C5|nr:CAP domain-containing protein [Amylibacter sp. SFDW26]KAB7614525.1 CAP domain-containing protein [Amylibacter sp. SFDW26]